MSFFFSALVDVPQLTYMQLDAFLFKQYLFLLINTFSPFVYIVMADIIEIVRETSIFCLLCFSFI